MRVLKFLLLFCFVTICLEAKSKPKDRRPSPPYITGDGFRAHCRYIIDKTNRALDCSSVREGDAIFVQTEYLPLFFIEYHPRIRHPYVLVTHNSDLPIPGCYQTYLGHPKILAWFGQNVEGDTHPKLHPLPIGLENRQYSNGDLTVVTRAREQFLGLPKVHLLYNNFSLHTSFSERSKVYELFKQKTYCHTSSRKPYPEYLRDLAESKFVLCPRGNGLDCHRAWESIYMGAIPIVKSSASDSLFEKLPVLIVQDWSEVTEELLSQKYDEIWSNSYSYDSLHLNFWLNKIDAIRLLR